jgi:hypothetical protein
LQDIIKDKKGDKIALMVAPDAIRHAVGYGGKNRDFLKKFFKKVVIKASSDLSGRQYHVSFD